LFSWTFEDGLFILQLSVLVQSDFDIADFTWRSIDMNCLCLSMMIKSACVSRSCWRWRQHVMRFFNFLLFFTFFSFLLLPPFTFGLDFKFQCSLISWNVDHYLRGRTLPVGWLISWLCSGVLMLLLLYWRMAWGARLYFILFYFNILLFIHFILLIFSSLNFLFVSSVPFASLKK